MRSTLNPVKAALMLAALTIMVVPSAAAVAPASPPTGTVTACTSLAACSYKITGPGGTGSASTTWTSISFQLPGEKNTTHGGIYSVVTLNVSGAIHYMLGTFSATDVNTGNAVIGSTHTNITVIQHCSHNGCYQTYSVNNGSIIFHRTVADGTSAAVSSNPTDFVEENTTVCTMTVTDLRNASVFPTGKVTFTTSYSYLGTFSKNATCTLSKGSCSVKFTPGDGEVGTFPIYASYHGAKAYYKSSANTLIYVSSGGD